MFEPAVGNGDGGWGEVYMPRNFCTLTAQTVLSIHPDVPSHTSPAKLAADQLYRCFHAWVCYVVQRGDGGVPEGGRNQGSEGTCGDVAEQFNSLHQLEVMKRDLLSHSLLQSSQLSCAAAIAL